MIVKITKITRIGDSYNSAVTLECQDVNPGIVFGEVDLITLEQQTGIAPYVGQLLQAKFTAIPA